MENELVRYEIDALDRLRYDAMVRADVASLARILDDQLVYTHSDGTWDDKQSYLGGVSSGKWVYQRLTASGRRTRLYKDTAFIDGNIRIDVLIDGVPSMLDCRYLAVWIRRQDHWQMVAWHATRIPAP